jgi:hypothetical protein
MLSGSASRVCVAGDAPCADTSTCDEGAGICRANCTLTEDADADGHAAVECGGDDCDDNDPLRYPGNTEVCDDDSRDEDCDSSTFGVRDADGDGATDRRCCNLSEGGSLLCGTDCDDTRAAINPMASEVCDLIDNDCDASTDEGTTVAGFADRDGDGRGDPDSPLMACAGTGAFSIYGDDCDDTDPSVHGNQVEICDGEDNDCDGSIDEMAAIGTWYPDGDGDGYGTTTGPTMMACERPDGYSLSSTDCDDSDARIHPGATELCDGLDQNCSAGGGTDPIEDFDRDGQIADDYACSAVRGGLPRTDCDDRNPDAYDGQTAYLTAPRADGTYDYNCDGTDTRRYARGRCVVSGASCAISTPGFSTDVACGRSGAYITACGRSGSFCYIAASTTIVQSCR